MKKLKYCVLGLSLMTIGFFAGGCADNVNASDNYGFTLTRKYRSNYIDSYILVDSETGVNYIIVSGNNSKAITTRLNSDGSIYIEK